MDKETGYTVSKERLTKLHNQLEDLESIDNLHKTFVSIIGGCNSTVYWSVLNEIRKNYLNKNQVISTILSYEEKKEQVQEYDELNKYKNQVNNNYVLVIDEINRGNVSEIFGELITLVEDDKRLGEEEALIIELPYSKKKFALPSNLYIIGTMNTADRSVEALDTALRRRFSFKEMMPDTSLIEKKVDDVEGIDVANLLKMINDRIEKLIDKDHTIGHSYFLKVESLADLKTVFQDKIIPLLQEYFYGDYGKIGLILGKGFIEVEKSSAKFADFEYELQSDLDEEKLFNIKELDEKEFKAAIETLLGKDASNVAE
jgi:5-methylcytosine-specific restriction enzyme B